MANTKISELIDVTSVAITDVIPVVNENETKKISVQQLLDTVKNNIAILNIKLVESVDEVVNENILYLIPNDDEDDENIYNEYMLINNNVELVGGSKIDLSSYYTKEDVNKLLPDVLAVQMSGYLVNDNSYNFSSEDIERFNVALSAKNILNVNDRIPYILYFGGSSSYSYADSMAICSYHSKMNNSDGTNWHTYKCLVYRNQNSSYILEERTMAVKIQRSTGLVVGGTITAQTKIKALTPSNTDDKLSIVNKEYVDTAITNAITNAITTTLEGEY